MENKHLKSPENLAIDFADWLYQEPQYTQWSEGKTSTKELFKEFKNKSEFRDKPTYILVHNHRFGVDVHPFKSDNYFCGFYNGENDENDSLTNIQRIIDKLDLDVEFDRSEESIEIFSFDLKNIIDID